MKTAGSCGFHYVDEIDVIRMTHFLHGMQIKLSFTLGTKRKHYVLCLYPFIPLEGQQNLT